MNRITHLALIAAMLVGTNAQAFETIVSGVFGSTTERMIYIPTLDSDGLPDGFTAGKRNMSVIYVNCRARVAVARVTARKIPNASGRNALFRNNATVADCVGIDIVDFINEVCDTNFDSGDIAEAVTSSTAVYSYPRRGYSVASIVAVGQL